MTSDLIYKFPAIYSSFNGIAAFFLIMGLIQIKKKNEVGHKKFMMAAFFASTMFLIFYLIYHYSVGHVPFNGQGFIRTVYFVILVPHIILAVAMLPFIFMAIIFAIKDQREKHKKIVKFLTPVWLYVSVTGVVIYLMAYQLYPAQQAVISIAV